MTSTDHLANDSQQVRGLYRERAHLLAALAATWPSALSYNDPTEPTLPVLYVDTPVGQVVNHINPDDLTLFAGTPSMRPTLVPSGTGRRRTITSTGCDAWPPGSTTPTRRRAPSRSTESWTQRARPATPPRCSGSPRRLPTRSASTGATPHSTTRKPNSRKRFRLRSHSVSSNRRSTITLSWAVDCC